MKLEDLAGVAGPLGHADRIMLFGWWLHVYGVKETFMPAEIGKCYDKLHLDQPSAFGPYIATLSKKGGGLLKNSQGYRLEGTARAALQKKYGQAPTTVHITTLLGGLPAKLPTLAERTYLDETLTCYKNGAVRAAIVMTWNLAYAHLCDHIFKNRLADFNARWLISLPGMHSKKVKTIAVMDDFNKYLKEQEVLDIARDAAIIVKNVHSTLEIGLTRRNMAAHPNNVVHTALQTEAHIEDLVNNAVLKIA